MLSCTAVEISVASQLFTGHSLKNRAVKCSMCRTSRLNVLDSNEEFFLTKANLKSIETENESIGGNYLQRQKECQGLFSATWKKWRLGKHTSNELIEQLFKSLVTIEE